MWPATPPISLFDTSPGGPFGARSATTANAFSISTAQSTATELATSGDGRIFALRTQSLENPQCAADAFFDLYRAGN